VPAIQCRDAESPSDVKNGSRQPLRLVRQRIESLSHRHPPCKLEQDVVLLIRASPGFRKWSEGSTSESLGESTIARGRFG
jgi:hypothetical protein